MTKQIVSLLRKIPAAYWREKKREKERRKERGKELRKEEKTKKEKYRKNRNKEKIIHIFPALRKNTLNSLAYFLQALFAWKLKNERLFEMCRNVQEII